MTSKSPPMNCSVACVGAGYFSQFHINAWNRVDYANLVGIADVKQQAPRSDGVPQFGSVDELLEQCRPQVLDIITPPNSHKALIERALTEDCVDLIVCQKPFCGSLEEATNITQAAKEAGKALVVHENFRFQPWFRIIKNHTTAGTIGRVLQLTIRLRPGDGQGENAYLARQPYFQKMPKFLIHETGVHYVDTFRYLLGEPNALYADLRKLNPAIAGEDAGYVMFEYPQGIRALLDGNRLLDHSAENPRCTMCEAVVEGTEGTLMLRGDGSVSHRKFGETEESVIYSLPETDQFGGDCAFYLQRHVIEHFRLGTALENQAEDYLKVLQLEELIYQSANQGMRMLVNDSSSNTN